MKTTSQACTNLSTIDFLENIQISCGVCVGVDLVLKTLHGQHQLEAGLNLIFNDKHWRHLARTNDKILHT